MPVTVERKQLLINGQWVDARREDGARHQSRD
jgi:hypothetical protein